MTDERTDEANTVEPHTSESIFTPEETVSLLKGFITAFLRGKLEVDIPSAQEIMDREKSAGRKIEYDEARTRSMQYMDRIEREMQIVMGNTPSTSRERAEAVKTLTQLLIRLRQTKRLTGEFETFDNEAKLTELIEKVDAIGMAFETFIKWLRGL